MPVLLLRPLPVRCQSSGHMLGCVVYCPRPKEGGVCVLGRGAGNCWNVLVG